MSGDDDELSAEDLRLGRLIIRVIYELAIALLIAITMLTAYAGYWSWPWYLVIPIAAALIFGTRVLRRYFLDIWLSVGRELGDVRGTESSPRPRRQSWFRPTGAAAIVFGVAVLLAIAAFWYGIGIAVRIVLQLT